MKFGSVHIYESIRSKLSRYRFELRHLSVFFVVLIAFQIFLGLFQKSLLSGFLSETQNWFQKYYAERLAIVTSTNVELLFENHQRVRAVDEEIDKGLSYSLNVIIKQQLIQRSVEDICLILVKNNELYVIDNGQKLYAYFDNTLPPYEQGAEERHRIGVKFFSKMKDNIKANEKIISSVSNEKTFDVLVPFVPDGEYRGVLYMRVTPEFSFLTDEVRMNFDQTSIIFSALIFVGLIAIFLVSSHAVEERNEAQQKLLAEHEENLKKQIQLEKESVFTKRIYHTHHKAEKIMGFIKSDVRTMRSDNLDDLKQRVITYSNFISRIIYDMKWYDQDINTIISPAFNTNVNAVITFIVQHVFLRVSSKNEMFKFTMELDPAIPTVHVNEFIIWEIIEPLIQNSIDHGGKETLTITVRTLYDRVRQTTYVHLQDNGQGIKAGLLEPGYRGIKKIFLEKDLTQQQRGSHSGYGCYIAYQMAAGKCGWDLDAENLADGGCRFTITIKN
ncbi:MAG TPA: ATP-binding protein [Bacteroidota bacterium]|nr:ATP-binding protein [Bacteroidota bacterium]